MSGKPKDKVENQRQKIKVFARTRPLNNSDISATANAHLVIEVPSSTEVIVKQHNGRKFRFNRAYGPNSSQLDIYLDVVAPHIRDLLAGYNCTVFTYGQTGSGKSYTMLGDFADQSLSWKNDGQAGFIPRACLNLFDELDSLIETEYTVQASYIELYNEEIIDLLAEDNHRQLRIYEDIKHKGHVYLSNLTEQTLCNRKDIYDVLTKREEFKKNECADNKNNRFHTIFSITIHIKEITVTGSDLIKTAKLNLVDLAGSENIHAATKNPCVREPTTVNLSLINLEKVVNALNEGIAYIPYRESKLTRILQDSLGGSTKTSFVMTISPAGSCLEETVYTLDFANRARNISNIPHINEKTCHEGIIKALKDEAERLKKDLAATRTGNGFLIDSTNYEKLLSEKEEYKKIAIEKKETEKTLREEINRMEIDIIMKEKHWGSLVESFELTKKELARIEIEAKCKEEEANQEKYLAQYFEKTNKEVTDKAKELLQIADKSFQKNNLLHKKVDTLYNKLSKNTTVSEKMFLLLNKTLESLKSNLKMYQVEHNAAGHDVNLKVNLLTDIAQKLFDAIVSVKATVQEFLSDDEGNNFNININKLLEIHSEMFKKIDQLMCCYNKFTELSAPFFTIRKALVNEINNLFDKDNTEAKNIIKTACETLKILEDINETAIEVIQDVGNFKRFVNNHVEPLESMMKSEEDKFLNNIQELELLREGILKVYTNLKENNRNLEDQINLIETLRVDFNENIDSFIRTNSKNYEIVCHTENKIKEIDVYETYLHESKRQKVELMDKNKTQLDEFKNEMEGNLSETRSFINDLKQCCSTNQDKTLQIRDIIEGFTNKLSNIFKLKPGSDSIVSCKNALLKDVERISKNDASLHSTLTSILDDMCSNLKGGLINQLEPAKHEGDSPLRETYKYPSILEKQLHRNKLLEKYKQMNESASVSQDISD